MSDRIIELRVENTRLKNEVQNLENKVLALVGMISLESSGGPERKNVLNEHLIKLITSTSRQLNIVSPKIDKFYSIELKKLFTFFHITNSFVRWFVFYGLQKRASNP